LANNEIEEEEASEEEQSFADQRELVTGLPDPYKYDRYVINRYSFPKGLA